jgi:hypothetical protein
MDSKQAAAAKLAQISGAYLGCGTLHQLHRQLQQNDHQDYALSNS